MTKEAFLADPHFKAMQPWVADRFDKTSGWRHTYVDRRTHYPWSCNGLTDAFGQYRWNRKQWPENKTELDGYRHELRRAVAEEDIGRAAETCRHILRWGGVLPHNGSYLRERRSDLLAELRHLRAVIDGDHTPTKSEMHRDPSAADTECRMNAGFVKIYSLLCDYCVMYDGRLGAALGLLVRQFCEDTGRTTVPPCLTFAFGSPKEAPNARCPKLRDPSRNELRFPRLRPNPRFHTAQVCGRIGFCAAFWPPAHGHAAQERTDSTSWRPGCSWSATTCGTRPEACDRQRRPPDCTRTIRRRSGLGRRSVGKHL